MNRLLVSIFVLVSLAFCSNVQAQRRRVPPKIVKKPVALQSSRETSNTAVVIDERLAVLRSEPSLFARPIQRMRRGRIVAISGTREADGVIFYKVIALPNNSGWVQAEAVAGKSRRGDDERLAKLVQASEGFEQIERAGIFLENYPNSALRPAILLLLGDLLEDSALKMSNDATKKLDRREMAASGAPLHSFYLNYTSLDRFRKINVDFVFNPTAKLLHYDGASWREIVSRFPKSAEAAEAQKRLDALKEKMEVTR